MDMHCRYLKNRVLHYLNMKTRCMCISTWILIANNLHPLASATPSKPSPLEPYKTDSFPVPSPTALTLELISRGLPSWITKCSRQSGSTSPSIL